MALLAAFVLVAGLIQPGLAQAAPAAPTGPVHVASVKRTKGWVANKQWKKAALAPAYPVKKITKKQRARYEKQARQAMERAKKPMPVKVTPAAGGLSEAYKFCNPVTHRDFCSPSIAWRDYMYAAWDWSDAHRDHEERKPVPYPLPTTGLGFKLGFVYLISFRPTKFVGPVTGGKTIWKFGETGQDDWAKRAGQSLAQCTLVKERICWPELVAVTVPWDGKHHARYTEASAVKKWNLDYGGGRKNYHLLFGYLGCPPGQRSNCR